MTPLVVIASQVDSGASRDKCARSLSTKKQGGQLTFRWLLPQGPSPKDFHEIPSGVLGRALNGLGM